jgi:flagellin
MKSDTDVENYNTEFKALQQQLFQISTETFNGTSLFATTQGVGNQSKAKFGTHKYTISVFTSDRGDAGSKVSLNKALLQSAVTFTSASSTAAASVGNSGSITLSASVASAAVDISTLGISFFNTALENVATLRAENGATMARFGFAEDHLRLSKANLESANSRIMDVDVAEESTRLAKFNILSQASAAMLAQANLAPNSALMLLG